LYNYFACLQNVNYVKFQVFHLVFMSAKCGLYKIINFVPSFVAMQNKYMKLQILHHVFQSQKFEVLHFGKYNVK